MRMPERSPSSGSPLRRERFALSPLYQQSVYHPLKVDWDRGHLPAPIIGGKTMPPEIPATRNEPPLFVCRPNPRSPNVKIVAKQQLSKQNTIISNAMLVVPLVVMAAIENMKHIPRYVASMYLGLKAGIIIKAPARN